MYYDAKKDKHEVAANCRQIGRKTFFQRGDRLVDSTVTEAQEKSAKKIERYSREYFDLIERYGKHVAQYLALDDRSASTSAAKPTNGDRPLASATRRMYIDKRCQRHAGDYATAISVGEQRCDSHVTGPVEASNYLRSDD